MDARDRHLLTLLADDLDSSYEQLVVMYQHRLYAFALLRVHSTQIAEEIVQLALERAYYALKNYTPQRIQVLKLEAWLYEITRNIIYNYTRDYRVRAARLPSMPLDVSEGSPLLEVEDEALGPDEEVCRRETRQELETQVARLPGLYRETMSLYYFDDLTCREIAERLHQPIGTVKANVYRGTQQLRKTLGAEVGKMR